MDSSVVMSLVMRSGWRVADFGIHWTGCEMMNEQDVISDDDAMVKMNKRSCARDDCCK